jgi:hypothetical protein
VAYSAGASAGALLVTISGADKAAETACPSTSRSRRRRKKKQPRPLLSRIIEYATQMLSRRPHLPFHGDIGRVEHPG